MERRSNPVPEGATSAPRREFLDGSRQIAPVRFPHLFRQALAFVAPSVLAAIVMPGLFAPEGAIDLGWTNPRWIAGLVAIAVAIRLRTPLAAIVAGMAALWALQWGLPILVW